MNTLDSLDKLNEHMLEMRQTAESEALGVLLDIIDKLDVIRRKGRYKNALEVDQLKILLAAKGETCCTDLHNLNNNPHKAHEEESF